jgi:hypothetical protein
MLGETGSGKSRLPCVLANDRPPFGQLAKLPDEQRRDGAFEWSVLEDAAQEGRFIERFLLDP